MTETGRPRTFQEVLASRERLTLERALALVRAAALAVDALHAHQRIHGSLEPASFQVDGEDRVTLLPPGSAPSPDGSEDARPLGARQSTQERPPRFSAPGSTLPADSAPSRAYWSPQRQAGEPARPTDDLYAVGLVASALLTGAPNGPLESPLPDKVAAVLRAQRSWAPSERFASGAELAHELDRAAARPPVSQEPAWAAARRVAQARAAHSLALATPPDRRPRKRVPPAPIPSHPILRHSTHPDLPLPGRWVVVLVAVLCSVYLFPLYFMLFQRG